MSDCGVCLYTDDSDGVNEFTNITVRKARKQHECSECLRPILVGAKYEYAVGKFDGEIWTTHTCLECAEIAEAFYCDGRMYGGILWEDMECAFDQLNESCFDKLQTVSAKKYLRERWMQWKFKERL